MPFFCAFLVLGFCVTAAALPGLKNEIRQDGAMLNELTALLELQAKTIETMETRLVALETKNDQTLERRLDAINESLSQIPYKPQVAFHVGIHVDTRFTRDAERVKWNRTMLNEGSAYNPRTGLFTAPTCGLYFFSLTTRAPQGFTSYADAELMANRQRLCLVDSYARNDAGACSGVVHLDEGETAWVQSYQAELQGGSNYRATATTFSGFLMDVDW